ncbi:13742_t:CDS:2, partial [Acaulospora colombiana]
RVDVQNGNSEGVEETKLDPELYLLSPTPPSALVDCAPPQEPNRSETIRLNVGRKKGDGAEGDDEKGKDTPVI